MKRAQLLAIVALAWLGQSAQGADGSDLDQRPKLVVLIVIDQLPAYMIAKLADHFEPGGLRLFMDKGSWFEQAHYRQAATLTGVGHATIATGGLPAGHGISGNDWYDREHDRDVYCVEDRAYHWVGGKNRPEDGTSPRNMTSTTFGDEWIIAQSFRPRVVGISLKDRGSILLAGQLGKAFWYDANSSLFISSNYYFPEDKLPGWVEEFNSARRVDKYFHQTWNLLLPEEAYGAAADDRLCELPYKGLGRTFLHLLGDGLTQAGPDFYKMFASTPQANELTLDFAKAAIAGEQLGQHGLTDILCLSLTPNDYCGHEFGPESLEYHDLTLQTDRQLGRFFADLDRIIGLDQVVIVLTSDHGATPTPEYLAEQGLEVDRIDPEAIARVVNAALDQRFGPAEWSARFLNPGLSLRLEAMRQRGATAAEAERIAALAVRRLPGVATVFTRGQLANNLLPQSKLARMAAATFHPERSPDLVIIQKPYWYLYKEMSKNAGMHGSPYPYDAHVPLMLFGRGITAGRFTRTVHIEDLAPTITQYLGVPAPSASEGSPLNEILKN